MTEAFVKNMRAMSSYVDPESARMELPPICEYLERYSRGAPLFPRQKTLMKIIFLEEEEFTAYDRMVIDDWLDSTRRGGEVAIPLDLYDRIHYLKAHGYKHFKEIVYCGGRRAGKGFLGGKIAEYLTAQMIALGNPQRYYGIDESKDMYIDVLATTYQQAQGMLYNDIKDALLMDDFIAPHLYSTSDARQKIQTPADLEREQQFLRNMRKTNVKPSMASIIIEPHASNSASIRGRASFFQCFDELAHGLDGNASTSVYEAATPSLAQFGEDGMSYIPSSPWSEQGKFYELYQQAFELDGGVALDPTRFAIRIPSWAIYYDWEYDYRKKRAIVLPPSKSPEMRAREARNPDTFAVEFRAQFAKTENAYLNSTVVDELFEPCGNPDRNVFREKGEFGVRYVCHADAGRSQDLFAFAMGHREVGPDGFYHVFIDMYNMWQPTDFPVDEKGVRRIDYLVPLDYFRSVLGKFYVDKFTMDQWNSALILDQLKSDSMRGKFLNSMSLFSVDTATHNSNFTRWERFKTACYQGWVHIPKVQHDIVGLGHVCLPQEELKLLIFDGKRVDHQPPGSLWPHSDISDCISTVVANLLADQLDALELGNLTKVIGGAQGGYNSDSAPQPSYEELSVRGNDYMRAMGYY